MGVLKVFATVYYASYDTISETLEYDMRTEREFSYAGMPVDNAIRNRELHIEWKGGGIHHEVK